MKLQVTPYLSIDLTEPSELIELISDEDKLHFMQSLSCDDIIIKHVADQLVHGCTEDGYHGSLGGGNTSEPSTPLDVAKREISKSYSDFVRKEITSLENELKRQEARTLEFTSKYYDLLHERGNQS